MINYKKFKRWYSLVVRFESFTNHYEVCEPDVPAACRAVKKLIANSEYSELPYYIEGCNIIK